MCRSKGHPSSSSSSSCCRFFCLENRDVVEPDLPGARLELPERLFFFDIGAMGDVTAEEGADDLGVLAPEPD